MWFREKLEFEQSPLPFSSKRSLILTMPMSMNLNHHHCLSVQKDNIFNNNAETHKRDYKIEMAQECLVMAPIRSLAFIDIKM